MFQKTCLVAAMLCGFVLGGIFPPSVAADDCRERVRRAEENLKREIDRHGERSKKAEQARRDLERERSQCRFDEHEEHHQEPHMPR